MQEVIESNKEINVGDVIETIENENISLDEVMEKVKNRLEELDPEDIIRLEDKRITTIFSNKLNYK